LRIFGFKSFANKVEVNFPKNGLTSVVGPNGCGKSNIIDAIRWGLGEQKAKSLRSSKMEDVIFSGTANKPAMNMAEVSLVIENDKGVLAGGQTQIMITRRAYRNGDSMYLINNQPCRLKDIQHLFYDTGMGAASYSLMEAKMIDSVLSDKDDERRLLFEEAAGISKYKKQRAETKRQLEKVTLDLTRVEDNLTHAKKSTSLFERQAEKAERWRLIKDSLTKLELSYNVDSFLEIKEKYVQFQKDVTENNYKTESVQTRITELETQLEEKKLTIVDDETKLQEYNQIVANTNAEAVSLTNEIERARDRIRYLTESMEKREEERHSTEEKLSAYADEKQTLKQEYAEYSKQFAELEVALQRKLEENRVFIDQYQVAKEQSTERSEEHLDVMSQVSELTRELEGVRAEKNLLENQRDELEESLNRLLEEERVALEERSPLEQEHVRLEEETTRLRSQFEAEKQTLEENSKKLEQQRDELMALEKEKVALETQYKVYKAMKDSQEGVQAGAQYLIQEKKEAIRGALFDLIQVSEEYIGLVEQCIGDNLQTLVLNGEEASVEELLSALKSSKKGQALLYLVSDNASTYRRERSTISASDASGFKGWLVDHIQWNESNSATSTSLQGLIEYVLGHYAIVDSSSTAQALCEKYKGQDIWFVTQEGDKYHASGVVQGGYRAQEQVSLLENRTRLETIARDLDSVTEKWNSLKESVDQLAELQRNLKENSGQAESLLRQKERSFQETAGKLKVLISTTGSLGSRREDLETKQAVLLQRYEELELRIEPLEGDCESKRELQDSLQRMASDEKEKFQELEYRKSDLERSIREMEGDCARLKNQLERGQERIQFLDTSEEEQKSRQVEMSLDGQGWLEDIANNNEIVADLTDKIHLLNERLAVQSRERDEAKEVYDTKMLSLDTFRDELKVRNNEFHQFSRESHQLELKMQQANTVVDNIKERMFEVYEVHIDDPQFTYEKIEYNPDTAEKDISQYKEDLRKLGNVNVGALEDYEEEKKKLEDVQKQFDDLEKARVDLEKTIRRLDKVAREQFLETFGQIQKNFQKVFSTLFEGGQGQLTLDEEADPLDARIEINASPSGKKMRGVTLLSGGERALTAISMLFSLYLVRTSPYCIMDEVDGPLDDANIGRFVNLLRRFSDETQFIVVTHNKRTMAASDMLYGVTQEIRGISQLASVRLDEASVIAG
jgi:chromosome segregation protein